MWGQSGWNLSNNPPYFHVANFFRKTAQEIQKEKWLADYKGNRKRRIPEGPRRGRMYRVADVPVGFVSFFDVLWRYRKWANYKEAQALIEGQQYDPHIDEFDVAFGEIVETTSAALEHVLCIRLGADILRGMYDEYLNLVRGKIDCSSVERRLNILCGQA